MSNNLRDDNDLVEQCRRFRKNPTRSEAILWEALRNRRLVGEKFYRQVIVGPFIVDFLCRKQKLIIEIDGPIHEMQKDRDGERQLVLEKLGYQLLRLKSVEVENDLSYCLARIEEALIPNPSPTL